LGIAEGDKTVIDGELPKKKNRSDQKQEKDKRGQPVWGNSAHESGGHLMVGKGNRIRELRLFI
jgi:hypothetical protein